MPRWLRVIRGVIGTGLTFSAGAVAVGTLFGLVGVIAGMFSAADAAMGIARFLIIPPFLLGVVFSGGLAVLARGRLFDRLSLRFVTALGAGGGLLYFLLIAINGARVWSVKDAIANFAILTIMGAGSAGGMLIVARKARGAIGRGDDVPGLGEGMVEEPLVQRRAEEKVNR